MSGAARGGVDRRPSRRGDGPVAWLFLAPSLAGFVVFLALPVLVSLALSFCEWDVVSGLKGIRFAGLANYAALPSDPWFLDSLRNNLVYTAVTVPSTMLIALLVAAALHDGTYFRTALRVVFVVPYIVNIIALSVVWMALFHPSYSPVNAVLHAVGVASPPRWLASPQWAFPTIIMMMVYRDVGYDMVIYLAGLQTIPVQLHEAARIDGASVGQAFARVTLPLLAPTTFFLFVTRVIASFLVFGPINVMTQGGPGTATTVLVYYVYRQAFRYYHMGYGSAIVWVMFVLIFAVTTLQWRGRERWSMSAV